LSNRNKRGKTGAVKTATVNMPPDQLEAQARQALSAVQYKLAIQHLKLLLKQAGETDRIHPLLQEAYAGRAEQLAAQGMLKEAAAIWEVAIPYGLDPADPRYIGWLVKMKQYPRLMETYRKVPVENRRSLQPILAAALLSGAASLLLTSLPDEDPVRAGYGPALQLLEAWCGGEGVEQLQERMKAIPFRSPYRDLRQAIQSWLLLENAPEQARESLERIAPDSPFRPLADQALLAQLPWQEALPQLSALSPAARACQLEARGWSDSRDANLLRDVLVLVEEPSAEQLFALLKRVDAARLQPHVQSWLRDAIKRAWGLVAAHPSSKFTLKHLERVIGQLNPCEQYHLQGLLCIAGKCPLYMLAESLECFRGELLLESDAGPTDNRDIVFPADRRLAVALINRFLALQWQQKEGRLTDHSVELLRQSLQFDPDDQKVWIELIEHFLQARLLVNARNTLKNALEHHPDDTAILELGVRVAVAGGAFKKAAGYAKHILELDPINTRVRQYLQNAHISHVRKLLNQEKWHLAHKELAEAQQWKSTPLNATIIQILQAYLAYQDGQGGESDQGGQGEVVHNPLQHLMETSEVHPVALQFLCRHESIHFGMTDRTFRQLALNDEPWKKLERQGLLVLVDTVEQLMAINPDTATRPLNSLLYFLEKAARLKFSESEGERLCEFWLQAKQDELLVEYARRLQKSWPKRPVFTYYRFYYARPFTNSAFSPLKSAMEQARAQGDVGLSSRIEVLLRRLFDPDPSRVDFDFYDDLEAEQPEDLDDMGDILKMFSEEFIEEEMRNIADQVPLLPYKEVADLLSEFLDKKTVRSVRERFGEKAVRDLFQMVLRGGDPLEFIADLEGKPVKKKPVQGRLF